MSSSLLAAVLALAAPLPADEAPKAPQGLPPTQVIARADKDGTIEVLRTGVVYRVEDRTRAVNVNGRVVQVVEKVSVPMTSEITVKYAAKDARLFTAAGKELDPKELPERLKKKTIVLLSENGQLVDPFYLKVVKEDTLVLVVTAPPPMPAPGVVTPVPDPPPAPPKDKK
jgi:hypothetical protein